MAEKEQSGMLRVVVILGLILVIALGLIFGVKTLNAKMSETSNNTADQMEKVANSEGNIVSASYVDSSGMKVSVKRIGTTVYATYGGAPWVTKGGTWIGMIPDGYYPTQDIVTKAQFKNDNQVNLAARPNGRIITWNLGSTDGKQHELSGTATWETKDPLPKDGVVTFNNQRE